MRYCLLRMVTANENHNKDYEMEQLTDTQFVVRYGRYGAAKQEKIYSLSMWEKLYAKKIRKGYKDITDYVNIAVKKTKTAGYKPIADEGIRQLIDTLLSYANDYVKTVYSISKRKVTPQMLIAAQKKIDQLWDFSQTPFVDRFNSALQDLLVIIPQRISNVDSILAKDANSMSSIVDAQQTRLDTLASLIDVDDIIESDIPDENDKRKTILEAFGLKIRPCSEQENTKIKEKLSKESEDLFDCAWRIEQENVERRFNEYIKKNNISRKNIHFFWHGTRNENVWSILKTSLLLNPKATITGKMFGYGLYFATRAKKSIGYTSLCGSYWAKGASNEGYLICMKVAYKNPMDIYTWEHKYSLFREKDIRKLGYDAVFAHKGTMLVNDEVIVYSEAAVCPRYLIRLRNK